MIKTRVISVGIVVAIWTVIFTIILLPSVGYPPSFNHILVIIGIGALFAVIFEFFRPLRKYF